MFHPCFNTKAIEEQSFVFKPHVERLVAKIIDNGEHPIELQELLLDNILGITLGKPRAFLIIEESYLFLYRMVNQRKS